MAALWAAYVLLILSVAWTSWKLDADVQRNRDTVCIGAASNAALVVPLVINYVATTSEDDEYIDQVYQLMIEGITVLAQECEGVEALERDWSPETTVAD